MVAAVAALLLTLAPGKTQLPARVDLRPRFDRLDLPICQQDGPWCWAFTTIGVLEYEESQFRKHRVQLSPGYLAWAAQETDSQGTGGSNFGRANRGLEQFGSVTLAVGGVPQGGSRLVKPDDSTVQLGKEFDGLEFRWIRFWNRQEMDDAQLKAIKADVAGGHPVAVGMMWPNQTAFYPGSWLMKVPARDQIFDGHCVILVGYTDDPSVPGGGSFLFRNSWGAGWADHGYSQMPYELLRFCINDAFSLRVGPHLVATDAPATVIDAENLEPTDTGGSSVLRQSMRRYGRAWGNKRQIYFAGNIVGDGFTVQVPFPSAGKYEVRLVITRAQNYGQFSVKFPDGTTSKVVEGAGPGVSRSTPISLGTHGFRSGTQPLHFTVTGMCAASGGFGIGLCEVQLVPMKVK